MQGGTLSVWLELYGCSLYCGACDCLKGFPCVDAVLKVLNLKVRDVSYSENIIFLATPTHSEQSLHK